MAMHANRSRHVRRGKGGNLRADASNQNRDGFHLTVPFDDCSDLHQRSRLAAEEVQLLRCR